MRRWPRSCSRQREWNTLVCGCCIWIADWGKSGGSRLEVGVYVGWAEMMHMCMILLLHQGLYATNADGCCKSAWPLLHFSANLSGQVSLLVLTAMWLTEPPGLSPCHVFARGLIPHFPLLCPVQRVGQCTTCNSTRGAFIIATSRGNSSPRRAAAQPEHLPCKHGSCHGPNQSSAV